MALLITDRDVEKLLSMQGAIAAAELALGELHRGKASNRPRQQFYADNRNAVLRYITFPPLKLRTSG